MPLLDDVLTAVRSYKQIDPTAASYMLSLFKGKVGLSVIGDHCEF